MMDEQWIRLSVHENTPGIVETDYSEVSITCEALRRYILNQRESLEKTDSIGQASKKRTMEVAEGVRKKLAPHCKTHIHDAEVK